MSSGVILAGLGLAAVGFGGRYIARTMPQLAQKMEVIYFIFVAKYARGLINLNII